MNLQGEGGSKYNFMRYLSFMLTYSLSILFLSVMSLTSCTDQNDNDDLDTFFEGERGGEKLKGDGVAFTRDSSSVLHVRLLAGDAELHYGVDIVVDYDSSDSYTIPEGQGNLTVIYGLDAVGDYFSSNGLSSDVINLNWNMEMGYVEGDFEFTSSSRNDGTELKVDGSFRVQVGDIGEPWDCGFLQYEPDGDGCSFIR